MIENIFTLKGTLYAKECRKVKNTKKPTEPDWEFYSIKIETKLSLSGRTITQIPELSLDKGLTYDGYEIGDLLEVDFYLVGKKISETWFKTECKAVHIAFAPMENGEVRTPRKAVDSTFTGAPPPSRIEETDDDPNNYSDLPF